MIFRHLDQRSIGIPIRRIKLVEPTIHAPIVVHIQMRGNADLGDSILPGIFS